MDVAGWLPAVVVLGLSLLEPSPCGAQTPPALDFLYIDASAGDASGGHTGVRLGETVFHYEYYSGGLIVLAKDPWDVFLHQYNDLQSRSVTLTRVAVSQEAYDRIRSHLFGCYVYQRRRLLRLDQLSEQHELLRRLADGADAVALEGLGFFSESRRGAPSAVELKSIVERRFGSTWLSAEQRDVADELGRTSFREAAAPAPGQDQPALWSVRLRELLSVREALAVLGAARDLADDALLTAVGNGGPLTERERAVAEEFRRQLADSVLTLLDSNRPDRGTALLLQMARYQALDRSLETGVPATLDPLPEEADTAQRLAPDAARLRDPSGERLLREARAELAAARETFVVATELRATAYSRFEAAQGRLWSLERARRSGSSMRVEAGQLLPQKSRAIRTGLKGTTEEFSRAAGVVELALDLSRKEVVEAYSYHLITHNCATEIVRDVYGSFANREQAQSQLGGALEPGERLSFIPFRLTAAVEAAHPSSATETLLSYRLRQLDRLYEQSGPFVWLKECNTLTSSLYSPSWAQPDGVFLFFTDDLVTPRPLLGTINLLYATAHAAGGILLSPLDRGALLARSLRGMLYSLPEIAFFNIRKGSFQCAPAAPGPGP